MARNGAKKKNKKSSSSSSGNNKEGGFLWVDPVQVRFQHSKIREKFSGCGRSIYETLDSIRQNEMLPADLPPIQVIVGPEIDSEPTYFSLNNRRLWVLKRCREEGLLENNVIQVRVRTPKSAAEAARYSIENCALEAKVMKESTLDKRSKDVNSVIIESEVNANEMPAERETSGAPSATSMDEIGTHSDDDGSALGCRSQPTTPTIPNTQQPEKEDSSDDSSDEDEGFVSKNPFSALSF